MNALDQMVQVALGEDYNILKQIGYIVPVQEHHRQSTISHCQTNSFGWMVTFLEQQHENSVS